MDFPSTESMDEPEGFPVSGLRPYMEFKKEHGRFPGCGTFQLWLLEDSDRAEWHAILQEKYERASFRPWLPVAPDPPKPE